MICLICRQAEVIDGFTAISFQRGEMHLVVKHVPARVCPNCGETYMEEEVAAQLVRGAEQVSKSGVLESVDEYNSLA